MSESSRRRMHIGTLIAAMVFMVIFIISTYVTGKPQWFGLAAACLLVVAYGFMKVRQT